MKRLLALPLLALTFAAGSAFAQDSSQMGLKEPIQVDGGLISGTPTPQWSYGIRLSGAYRMRLAGRRFTLEASATGCPVAGH